MRDADGLVIPQIWAANTEKWEKLPLSFRIRHSEMYEQDLAKAAAKASAPRRPDRAPAKRFTTDACIKWGKSLGWKLLDRERYDYRTKRHHDLLLGADACFEAPPSLDGLEGVTGMVYVQGAGRSERKEHRERFDARGGAARAKNLRVRFVYVEFVRGESSPVVTEWWA